MLRAIWNKSWRQHSTKQQLYGHEPPIMKTIKIRRTGYAGHCWRSKDELKSDVLWWTPSYSRAKTGRPARTFIKQSANTGSSHEDHLEARTIGRGGKRGSEISVLMARHDDDNDLSCPVGWGCRIHRQQCCRCILQPQPQRVSYDMILNNLMVKFQ